MIYIGECKNAILINRGMILDAIFYRGTHHGRFYYGIENKGVLLLWLSQILNTKKRLQGDNFANATVWRMV